MLKRKLKQHSNIICCEKITVLNCKKKHLCDVLTWLWKRAECMKINIWNNVNVLLEGIVINTQLKGDLKATYYERATWIGMLCSSTPPDCSQPWPGTSTNNPPTGSWCNTLNLSWQQPVHIIQIKILFLDNHIHTQIHKHTQKQKYKKKQLKPLNCYHYYYC